MPVKKRNIIPVFFLLFTKGNRESMIQVTPSGINFLNMKGLILILVALCLFQKNLMTGVICAGYFF